MTWSCRLTLNEPSQVSSVLEGEQGETSSFCSKMAPLFKVRWSIPDLLGHQTNGSPTLFPHSKGAVRLGYQRSFRSLVNQKVW